MSSEKRHHGPVRLDRVLDGVLQECGLSDRLAERRILDDWPAIVGPQIAAHARALDLSDGVLTLQADHGAWRQELMLLMPQIQAGFNGRFGPGTIKEIRWARPGTGRPPRDSQD